VPLTVIVGLPSDRVSQLLRDAVSDSSRAQRSTLLAVPRDADAIRARESVSLCVPVGVRVATLDGVVEAEWTLSGDGRRIARGLGRDVLLTRALASAGVSARPGRGAVDVLGTLAEHADARLPHGDADAGLGAKIVAALGTYRESLGAHRMIERAEACARLADSPPPADVIGVDGFVLLPRDLESLLAGWSRGGAEVYLSVPWVPGHPGTAASAALVERLVSAGATVRETETEKGGRPAELERAGRELFTGAPPGPGTGVVSLAVAEGEEPEARHIARAAADLVAAGAPPDDVVVAFADVSRHEVWIRRALDDEGIEADIEASVGVRATPFGGVLIGLRAWASGGLTPEGVGALLRSPFAGLRPEQADEADASWRRRGAGPGLSLLQGIVPLGPIATGFLELGDAPIGPAEAAKWKKLADRLLANGHPGAAPVPVGAGLLDSAAHRAFCRCLQEAVELGDGEVSADELWDRFAASRVMPRSTRHEGRVLVTGIDAVPLAGRSHVIIGGLTASEFPRRGSDDLLEGDSIARVMARLAIATDPEEHPRAERRAFYLAVVAAGSTLTLVRRGSDDAGAPLRESVFWDEFLDLYRRPGEVLPAGALPRLETVASDVAGKDGGPRVVRGELLGELALADLAAIAEVSPSEVETYLACPYRWFVERRVRARAADRAVDPAMAGRLAHEALAGFYREWRGSGRRRVTDETREEAAKLAADVAGSVVAREQRAETLEAATVLSTIAPSVVALVERDATFLPGYAPEHVEWAFGRESGTPAIDLGGVSLVGRADRIDVGPEGLVIVDYKRTHASPLAQIRRDGLVQLQLYAAAASRTLGLPVAGGLYRSLKDGSDRGFVRTGVSGTFTRNDVASDGEIEALLAEAVEAAVRVTGQMREGRIAPTPSARACAYCTATPFCGRAVAGWARD
jgi:RecB family exonuclease